MLFNSISYLIFFPIVMIAYYLVPWRKVRNLLLLAVSYYFYMGWDPRYIVLLFGCTVITYINGIFISIARRETEENVPREKRRTGAIKMYVGLTLIVMMGVLFWFKYANFLTSSLVDAAAWLGLELRIPKLNVTLPVGISFFTFQALGYNIDVFRGTVKAEKNFFRYALFVSFFPQLVAGPIERSGNLLNQFNDKKKFDPQQVMHGLMLMLWGYFLKVVIADRTAVLVDRVYNYYTSYTGLIPVIATIFFAVQIYCDFNGYTIIAIGTAQAMGFKLMQNFEQPYLATSVADFWRRWHISLTGWFRDYLYYPLGGNRKGKARQYLNIMIVFLFSGLWHGAAWTYVLWGGLNGLFQIIGRMLKPLRQKALQKMGVDENAVGHRVVQSLVTFVLVDFTWLFFRAPDMATAWAVIRQIGAEWNPWVLVDGSLYSLGLGRVDFWITVSAIFVLFLVDLQHERGVHLRELILRQPLPVRWAVYFAALTAILLFGVYGPGYDAAAFIYFQF